MAERKVLFRGFHPDGSGAETIMLNGEKITGEWLYWDVYGKCNVFYRTKRTMYCGSSEYISEGEVLPETVGQWVTTDKNDDDVFDGDILNSMYNCEAYNVSFNDHDGSWQIKDRFGGGCVPSHEVYRYVPAHYQPFFTCDTMEEAERRLAELKREKQ